MDFAKQRRKSTALYKLRLWYFTIETNKQTSNMNKPIFRKVPCFKSLVSGQKNSKAVVAVSDRLDVQ